MASQPLCFSWRPKDTSTCCNNERALFYRFLASIALLLSFSTGQAALVEWGLYPEPTAAVYDSRPGVTTSYRFSARTKNTPDARINSGGFARVTFPAGTDITGSITGTFNGIPIGAVTILPGNIVSFLVPGSATPLVSEDEDVEIVLHGIRNPLSPGNYSIPLTGFKVQNVTNSWDYNDLMVLPYYIGNLVPNSGFEFMGAGCPTAISNLNDAIAWDRPPGSINTPDYFNHCAPFFPGDCFFSVGVPNNFAGVAEPFAGNGYGGGVQYYDNGAGNHREYLQVRLSEPLVAGVDHIVSFRALLSFNSRYGVDGIGVNITNTPPVQAGNLSYNTPPTIEHPTIVSDKITWVLISSLYTAVGGEEYLTIGGFYNDGGTNRFDFGGGGYCSLTIDGAYYYFDDVSVIPTIFLPVEVLTFTGEPVEGDVKLNWKTGASEGFSHFELERSRDAYNFTKIGSENGMKSNYEFLDKTADPGRNFYRLKQVDLNGSSVYSEVVEVNLRWQGPQVKVYPNPADRYVMVDWKGRSAATEFDIQLLDTYGRLAYQEVGAPADGPFFSRQIPVEELQSGVYVLKVRLGAETAVRKLIVQ